MSQIRPGEKMHEQMIGVEDAPFTYSANYAKYYQISQAGLMILENKRRIRFRRALFIAVKKPDKLEIDELRRWIRANSHAWLKI